MPMTKTEAVSRAASLSFGLTAVLPLLMFAYTLVRLNGLTEVMDQITLGFALLIALLGFYILRVMVTRVCNLLQFVGRATEQGEVRVPGIGRI